MFEVTRSSRLLFCRLFPCRTGDIHRRTRTRVYLYRMISGETPHGSRSIALCRQTRYERNEVLAKRLQWPAAAFRVLTCACASIKHILHSTYNRGRPGGQAIASSQLLLSSSFLNVVFVKEADDISARAVMQAKYRVCWHPRATKYVKIQKYRINT